MVELDGKRFDEIRLAEPRDEDAIFDFLLALHNENGLFPVSEAKTREAIRLATDRRGGVIGLIEGDDGRIEASFGGVVESWWYSNAPVLDEKWNFVRSDCRRSPHAKRLIEFAKAIASQLHVPLHMGIMSTTRTEAKVRLYRRQLPYVGAFFMHGISPNGAG